MKKTALILMIVTILSKIVGFAREVTLSYFYGASDISDAYLISLTIPSVIFSFIGTGISTGYIPMYSKIENDAGEEEAVKFTNNLINTVIVSCIIITVFGALFAEQLVKVFASGFEGNVLMLATKFTRLSLFGVFFTGTIYILSGFLQIKNNYIIPASVGFPYSFIIIISILISSKSNVALLAIGSVAAAALQLIFILPFANRKGYKYKLTLDIKDEHMRNMLYIALPIIIGASVNQINVLVDRTLASQIAVGGISALNYANRLNGFVQGLFVLSVSTVMYPMISKMAAGNDMNGLKKTLSEAINSINLLVIPATVGAMIFAEPVVRLLFGRGAFDENAVSMTSYALFFYSLGMIGYGLREVLSRAFYSLQDTKTPMVNAAIAVGMNIVLNIILSRFLGIGGLALATSISAIFGTGLLFKSLRKKIGPFGMKNVTISFIKILCASLLMGTFAKVGFNALGAFFSSNLTFVLSICIGACAYFVIISMLNIPEVEGVLNTVRSFYFNRAGRK